MQELEGNADGKDDKFRQNCTHDNAFKRRKGDIFKMAIKNTKKITRTGIYVIILLFITLLSINLSSAQEQDIVAQLLQNSTDKTSVFYNSIEIETDVLKQLNKTKWVEVSVRLRDTSGIIITGTKEERIELSKQRDEWFEPFIDKVLITLSEDEFKLIRESTDGFSGSIAKKGLDKLIKDERVEAVYFNTPVHAIESKNNSTEIYIDPEIYKGFEGKEWVRVIINLKNMSEAENFLSIFSVNELKLIRKSTMRIGAEITKDGFERLINDSRVEAIYKDIIVQGTNNETDILKENNSYQNNAYISFKDKIKSNTLIIISIVLTLTIIILLIKKSKRK